MVWAMNYDDLDLENLFIVFSGLQHIALHDTQLSYHDFIVKIHTL